MGAQDERGQALAAGERAASATAAAAPELAELERRSRDQLLDAARDLGLTRVSKLKKHDLAVRILRALRERTPAVPAAPADERLPPLAAAPAPGHAAPLDPRLEAAEAARREPTAPPRTPPVEHIPWSYGLDRVTAAAVDPDRLFVWWEVTDPAIERARAALGPGGAGAWLALRVYDTTGRLFDGTNAHSYFDHHLSRDDRQWFFTIDKPTSTAVIEVGMKSAEGYFVRIARSGRVDFPRKEPAPWTEPEWMTVLASGETRQGPRGEGRRHAPAPAHPPGFDGRDPQHAPPAPVPAWILREGGEAVFRRLLEEGWERVEWETVSGEGWAELVRRIEWAAPAEVTSWEAGPFTYPVEIEPPRHEAWEGGAMTYRLNGVTHVVTGPWQVVIRNLGAFTARSVLGRWEVYRWRLAESGHEVLGGREARIPPGASEQHLGASERRWASGSELRLGGASEVFRLGASEVRFRGASERLYLGASEVRLRGASERRLAGASEVRLRGASEQRLGGASEQAWGGASERRLGGGSEGRLGGGSEARLGGASEQRPGTSAEPLPYPPVEGPPSAAAE